MDRRLAMMLSIAGFIQVNEIHQLHPRNTTYKETSLNMSETPYSGMIQIPVGEWKSSIDFTWFLD